MLLLGMDTSTSCGAIALTRGERLLAAWRLDVPRTHAGRLLPDTRRLLEAAGVEAADLDGICVTTGPGSFTGLRIGLTTAKALALVLGKPLAGVCTLDVLAEGVAETADRICAILDARRGELYTARYERRGPGALHRATDPAALTPAALAGQVRDPTLFVGDGVRTHGEALRDTLGRNARFPPPETHLPRPSVLCRLGETQLRRGEGCHPREVSALYVRPSDAERNRSKEEADRAGCGGR